MLYIFITGFYFTNRTMSMGEKKQTHVFNLDISQAKRTLSECSWQVGLGQSVALKKQLRQACTELLEQGAEQVDISLQLQATSLAIYTSSGKPIRLRFSRKLNAVLACDEQGSVIVTSLEGIIYQLDVVHQHEAHQGVLVTVGTGEREFNYLDLMKGMYPLHRELLKDHEALLALNMLISSTQQIIQMTPEQMVISPKIHKHLIQKNILLQSECSTHA